MEKNKLDSPSSQESKLKDYLGDPEESLRNSQKEGENSIKKVLYKDENQNRKQKEKKIGQESSPSLNTAAMKANRTLDDNPSLRSLKRR